MTATHLLVGNPTAQSGKNAERIERARALLESRGVACEVMATLPRGETIAAVRRALDGGAYACAIAMGGDGTFREVASGILASQRGEEVTLGMLPTGTANDQGRSFGLDAADDALETNVDVIARGHETRLDAGRASALAPDGTVIQEAMFFDSLGWGISARILAARNADRLVVEESPLLSAVYRDKLVYAGALIRTFLDSYVLDDTFAATLVADGERTELTELTDLIVKGTRVYGGAWVFDKTSRHDDGLFEVIPFRGKLDWTSKAIVDLEGNPVTEEMLNAVGIEHSKPFRAAHIELAFRHSREVARAAQVDGEEWIASDGARIDVLPHAVRLIVPA